MIPGFLSFFQRNNGVHEEHSPRTVIRRMCSSDTCREYGEAIVREFQIMSIDAARDVYIFRCVNCDNRIEIRSEDLPR